MAWTMVAGGSTHWVQGSVEPPWCVVRGVFGIEADHRRVVFERREDLNGFVCFKRWTRETANSHCVLMAGSEGRLGRIMYVAGATELERPFLVPLKFLTLHPLTSIRQLPSYLSLILNYFARQIERPQIQDWDRRLVSRHGLRRFSTGLVLQLDTDRNHSAVIIPWS